MDQGLALEWTWGLNTEVIGGVLSVDEKAVFYSAGHTGVIYRLVDEDEPRQQELLQGHCHPITCSVAIMSDWIATADGDSLIVIWQARTGTPERTIYDAPRGVTSMDSKGDCLVAISNDQISLWKQWRSQSSVRIQVDGMKAVRFHPLAQEIVSNGDRRTLFWSWSDDDDLKCHSPPRLSRKGFRRQFGKLTVSTFLPGTTQAVSATDDGALVVWDGEDGERTAVKVIGLCQGSINQIKTVNNYLVIAGDDGAVRVYDFLFRLEAWYEDVKAGQITSLSFVKEDDPTSSSSSLPNMIIGTRDACIVHLESNVFDCAKAEDRRGTVLVQGTAGATHGLAVHPTEPLILLIASRSVYLWDYEVKVLRMARHFDASNRPRRAAFSTQSSPASFLVIGCTGGSLKIVHPTTLQDVQHIKTAKHDDILQVKVSPDADYIAAADSENIYVWKRESVTSWTFVQSIESQSSALELLNTTLLSVGKDRNLLECDLKTNQGNVTRSRIEESAFPTACIRHPMLKGEFEERIITANSDFKFRQWNAENKIHRRTTAGPAFEGGGHVNGLVAVTSNLLAYSTSNRVLGLVKLPLDGNPKKVMGVVGHPGEICAIEASSCGRYVFTAGGMDPTVNAWRVRREALPDDVETLSREENKNDIESYLPLLSNEHGENVHKDLVDYFCYLQLRRQGEDSTDRRESTDTIQIADIPALMRAVGFYPSEQDIHNIIAEVRYSQFTMTGEIVEHVDFNEFVKLYVNHRPAHNVNLALIRDALATVHAAASKEEGTLTGCDDDEGCSLSVSWDNLQTLLKTRGDKMTQHELDLCLSALRGDEKKMPKTLTDLEFVDEVLGFTLA